jgi:hypothetical protein
MKTHIIALSWAASGLFFSSVLFGQLENSQSIAKSGNQSMSAEDQAWLDVQAAAFTPDFSKELPTQDEARKVALLDRAKSFSRTAAKAKDFYTKYPGHAKRDEAKLVEVRALVAASQAGDSSVDGELTKLVQAARADLSIPSALRVQMVSAYAFPKAMRNAKNHEGRLLEAAKVARSLAVEFPDQPQGPESLINIAASVDATTGRNIAQEVMAMRTSPVMRERAQALLDRLDLTGKPIAVELEGAEISSARSGLVAGRPTVVYTWASWSPGSIKLAAELKKQNPSANIMGICLDEDIESAAVLAEREGLPGKLIYDSRGRDGALAKRLKIRGAPDVILIDNQGVIRDVQGVNDFDRKIKSFGR